MPNRIVREGWLTSPRIDGLDANEERFFLRLLLKADDFGRYSANLVELKNTLFPLKEDVRATDSSRWLAACEKAGLVRCYDTPKGRFLEISDFRQRTRAKDSKFPCPPSDGQPPDISPSSAHVFVFGDGDVCEGGDGQPRPQEIPTEQEALDQTATAGIPADFARYVFQDWSSRQGKDAAGNVVAWPHYVTKRWAREQVEWKAGTHRGKKAAPSAARVGPTLAEVRALLVEKHGKTPEVENWAVSFYGHWNDPKRNWSRKSHPIDWKVELSQQVAKWKTAKQVNP